MATAMAMAMAMAGPISLPVAVAIATIASSIHLAHPATHVMRVLAGCFASLTVPCGAARLEGSHAVAIAGASLAAIAIAIANIAIPR